MDDFVKVLEKHQAEFGLQLGAETVSRLSEYYELILKHNPLLHLVAPGSVEDFAVRHILESLTLLEYLPENSEFADVGTGAGLPGIPCLLARKDLHGFLIESKQKKAQFLSEAREKLGLRDRMTIINRQFEEIRKPDVRIITCRALDKFTQKLPALLKWSENSYMVFFGGENLREELRKHGLTFREKLLPLSEKRFLFQIKKTKI
ncbi:MAG TPA: 16S rRNA (guanine(527)-N(7))-methyltransferase RsmG [Pyrinomonadaceae bacterium]|jgi:16S rRNA (guanine527-N7)-methyltransferase|nr:16S rRNA (guanine(527)-N(7))-methyltransferase RsmG [Pyrinomonadaceae bacterium]